MILLHPTYFPSVATLVALSRKVVLWEVQDNFQKQTYRNRCYIATDQGRHLLNIPILHKKSGEGRQRTAQVEADMNSRWAALHWKSLQAAYRSSPYFEYYEDELCPFFDSPSTSILELCLESSRLLCELLDLPFSLEHTKRYQPAQEFPSDEVEDMRYLVNAKQALCFTPPKYTQVFEDRHGFLENCSGLDLLFNEGPNARTYLSSCPWPSPLNSSSARMG